MAVHQVHGWGAEQHNIPLAAVISAKGEGVPLAGGFTLKSVLKNHEAPLITDGIDSISCRTDCLSVSVATTASGSTGGMISKTVLTTRRDTRRSPFQLFFVDF